MKQVFKLLLACAVGVLPMSVGAKDSEATEVRKMIDKVNQHWQVENSPEVRSFWDNAVYHTGNMEAYFLTGNETYRAYSETWANYNQWKGAKSDNRAEWKYSYGESEQYVLFGDYQICFQTYTDLYNLAPDDKKIKRAREVMEYQMSTSQNDYWWWSDALYMAMPVMTKLYKVTHNTLYLDKLYAYLQYSDSIMLVDCEDFDMTGIAESVREYFAPLVAGAVLRSLADEFAYQRGHDLGVRRYMWKMEY